MAKRRKQVINVTKQDKLMLPQNIISIGERVLETTNIYISQPVYKLIHKFTIDKTIDESGGFLIGRTIEDFGKTNIIISGFIEAKFCESTPTTLTFTHKSWEYCHKEIEKNYPNYTIIGWIHTHPNFGIFLSEYDRFIQQNFFKEPTQIAYVIDPIQKEEGFYFWVNNSIERCTGFFIYDKTGIKINAIKDTKASEVTAYEKPLVRFPISDFVMVVLCLISIVLMFNIFMLNGRINQYQLTIERYEQKFQLIEQNVDNQLAEIITFERSRLNDSLLNSSINNASSFSEKSEQNSSLGSINSKISSSSMTSSSTASSR